jgi:hypothetical protein
MKDDKRFLRNLKRDIKRAGNRKLRRHLKNVEAEPDDFDYGRNRSDVMNEPPVTREPPSRNEDETE